MSRIKDLILISNILGEITKKPMKLAAMLVHLYWLVTVYYIPICHNSFNKFLRTKYVLCARHIYLRTFFGIIKVISRICIKVS